MTIRAIHHVQLAMPAGEEAAARTFYAGVLELAEVEKPAALASRGGAWFEAGSVRVHLGVEADFRPARKAHPALLVDDLEATLIACRAAMAEVVETAVQLEGFRRAYVYDPFGNRLELLEADQA
jgi:catechol 2,3-dioxygenase-like lactoylglutathione lyase family enzyme